MTAVVLRNYDLITTPLEPAAIGGVQIRPPFMFLTLTTDNPGVRYTAPTQLGL